MPEELAHFSKVAESCLQVSLTNQKMISAYCKVMHESPRLEKDPQPKSLTREEEITRSTSYPSGSPYHRITVSKDINEARMILVPLRLLISDHKVSLMNYIGFRLDL